MSRIAGIFQEVDEVAYSPLREMLRVKGRAQRLSNAHALEHVQVYIFCAQGRAVGLGVGFVSELSKINIFSDGKPKFA